MVKNARDLGLVPGLGKFPWRWAWQPAPVFLLGESSWTEEPGRLQSMGLQRVRQDLLLSWWGLHGTRIRNKFPRRLPYSCKDLELDC